MPIYEFYCADCHTIFNFFSATVNTLKRPACPRCARPRLERKPSRFAVSRRRGGEGPEADDQMPDIDEARLERSLAALADEAEGLDEENPRQMARLVRKLYESTGLPLGGGIQEAIRRMEAGEDPDRIEEEMGDVLEEEDPFGVAGTPGTGRLRQLRDRVLPPRVDRTLHEL